MNVRRYIRKQCDTARFYVGHGLYKVAAEVLRDLADVVERGESAPPRPRWMIFGWPAP